MTTLLFLCGFLCLWLLVSPRRTARAAPRVWDDAPGDGPDGAALHAWVQAIDRADRRVRLLAPWRQPWPWWFLGACLAFAGICLGAGLWHWRTPDAPLLLLGGLLFGLAATFKAWAQAPAPLRARLRRRWHSRTRA